MNAPCQALYTPAIRSRQGSLVSIVSRTNVSQRSTSCSRRISTAWSSFSWTRVDVVATAADASSGELQRSRTSSRRSTPGSAPWRAQCTQERLSWRDREAVTDTEQHRIEERKPHPASFEREDPQVGARDELAHDVEIRVLAQMRCVEHRLAVALAEVPRPRLLEHGRHIRASARPEHPMDLCEVGVLVRNVLHDHRRDHGVQRGVGDVRHRVGRRDERVDPREPVRDAREPLRRRGRPRTRHATTR